MKKDQVTVVASGKTVKDVLVKARDKGMDDPILFKVPTEIIPQIGVIQKQMKFDYFKFILPQKSDFFGSSVLKPVIPIRIAFGEHSFQYEALIDSGADFSIFHEEIGEALGIDIASGWRLDFGGVQKTNAATAYLHEITLVIGGWPHKTVAGFSNDISEKSYGILGQKGFFDIFSVKFDYQKEEIELKQK